MSHAATESSSRSNTSFDLKGARTLLSAATVTGDDVCNLQNEKLGTIQDIMLDMHDGRIRYAVLSSGGFLGMGDRLFAVPWNALKLDTEKKRFVLDATAERLKNAPGFDKEHWPNMADARWNTTVDAYYDTRADSPPG